MISVWDVIIRDILYFGFGDIVPADGIFINKYGIKSDKSSATGESD
jgi:magnesium-transporting ATPase (P-type)